jgi:ATP-dependent exoDNAse (exonuclease V) beta subunit
LDLSADGKKLVAKFKLALEPILEKCGYILWRELVEEAWLTLGGPATVTDEAELEYAKIYLELLEANSPDIEVIQKKLHELYAPSTQIAKIQVMTIHKAKGLEFDHVIIPGIDRATRFDVRKLMLWFERPKMHGGSSLLLAPIEASGSIADPIYQYLQLVEQKKSFYETGRLLYVALTRSKKTAHLIGCIKDEVQKNSLLNQLV